MPAPNLSKLATRRPIAPTDGYAESDRRARKRALPASITQPHVVPQTLPHTKQNQARLLIAEAGDGTLVTEGTLLPELEARKSNLEGMNWALLAKMVWLAITHEDWDLGPKAFKALWSAPTSNASETFKMTLSPQLKLSFSEWEEEIVSLFPNKGATDDPVLLMEGALGTMAVRGARQGDRLEWQVLDMDLQALERWSKNVKSSAKQAFEELWSIYGRLGDAQQDADDAIRRMEAALFRAH